VQLDWERGGKGKKNKRQAACPASTDRHLQDDIHSSGLTPEATPHGALEDRAQRHVGTTAPDVY